MILLLKHGLTAEGIARLSDLASAEGAKLRILDEGLEGGRRLATLEGLPGLPQPDLEARAKLWPAVERVVVLGSPHPLVSRTQRRAFSIGATIRPADRARGAYRAVVGPETFVWIAGPCSVETPELLTEVAGAVARAGASMLRAGAFKPRSSPYSFQGLGRDGILLLSSVARVVGLPLVTEVLDPRDVEFVARSADCLQIGSRNMRNVPLLEEVGASGRPVLLKRGMSATIDEWLLAAEYVLAAGCESLCLCERGVRPGGPHARNMLDLAAVAVVKQRCGLPVIVDPSHATGHRSLVVPMAKAAVAAGADGVMVEVHPRPAQARSDAGQALWLSDLPALAQSLACLARLEGRSIPHGPAWRRACSSERVPRAAGEHRSGEGPS